MIRNEIMKQTIEAMQQKRPVVNTHVNATFCFSGMFSEYAIGNGRKKSTTSVKIEDDSRSKTVALNATENATPHTQRKSSQPTERRIRVRVPIRPKKKMRAIPRVTARVMMMVSRVCVSGWSKFDVTPAGGVLYGTSHGIVFGSLLLEKV